MEENKKIKKIPRRKFLSWIIPLLGSSAVVFSFKAVYSGSINTLLSKFNRKLSLKSAKSKRRHRNRQIWSMESLVLNIKSHIIHYPSIKLFIYYNQISDAHIKVIGFNSWEDELKIPNHFIKSKSGIILEKLALRELSIPLSNEKLEKATRTLSIAFSEQYNNKAKHQINTYNWRLYDLLLQLIALNSSIQNELKWIRFSEITKLVDFKFIKIPKKNTWVKSKSEFNKRASYIQIHSADYTKRIEKRLG